MGPVLSALLRWVFAAALAVSGGAKPIPDALARAIATHAFFSPLTETVDGPKKTAAMLVALSWSEGGFNPASIGDHGDGHCALGIYLPNNSRTAEGWTGAELDADPDKCVTSGLRILRESVARGPASCPFCIYARGPAWRNKCVHGSTEGACAEGEKPVALDLNAYRAALTRRALTITLETTP